RVLGRQSGDHMPGGSPLPFTLQRIEEPAGVLDQPLVRQVPLSDSLAKAETDAFDSERVALLSRDRLVGVLKQGVEAPGPALVKASVGSEGLADDVNLRVALRITGLQVNPLGAPLDLGNDLLGGVLAHRRSPAERAERALVPTAAGDLDPSCPVVVHADVVA